MSETVRSVLDIGNKVCFFIGFIYEKINFIELKFIQVFTLVFTFECIMKVMALSKEFFECGWNMFDLIIVSASILDLIFELVDGLSVLRGLRLVSAFFFNANIK